MKTINFLFVLLFSSSLFAQRKLTKKEISLHDGTFFKFKFNSSVLLKKRLSAKGKEIVGPGIKTIGRKKFLMSFSGIL